MAGKKDFYELLGVAKDADNAAIKSAYKKQAIKFHPDKNPGNKEAEEKFKEAAEAYDVLSDEKKRRQYDQFGHQAFQGGGGGHSGFSNFEDIFSSFGDIFGSDLFGGGGGGRRGRGRGQSGPPRGQDLQMSLTLTLEEIAKGVTKKVKLRRYNKCTSCDGAGGSGKQDCRTCGGQGQVRQIQNSIFGQMVNITTCPDCAGAGHTVKNRCTSCQGQGRVQGETTLDIDIPAGAEEGNYLTMRGEGHRGQNGGPAGDLIVVIKETKNERFERRGSDLYSSVEVPYCTMVLGGDIRVVTLDGEVDLRVPAGTQSEKIMRLRGKGLPELNSRDVGSLYVKLHTFTPQTLSNKERELLRELSELEKSERPKSFFESLKSAFT